jgi:putative spermidine/putrescine transport system permease protein
MITLGFYITPALLGGPENMMISQIIERQVNQLLNWNLAGALSVILMVGTVIPLWIYSRQLKRSTVFGR